MVEVIAWASILGAALWFYRRRAARQKPGGTVLIIPTWVLTTLRHGGKEGVVYFPLFDFLTGKRCEGYAILGMIRGKSMDTITLCPKNPVPNHSYN